MNQYQGYEDDSDSIFNMMIILDPNTYNIIYRSHYNGISENLYYDNKNNCTQIILNNGTIMNYDYDDNNNCIHMVSNSGFEQFMDYNDKNQCIHMSNNNCECNYEYDNYGNIILERYSISMMIMETF